MISTISLKNFKCYKIQKFEISPLTVFCGANSSGKSTAIQALSIPLQSTFDKEVLLNGVLTEVGFIKDIHNRSSDDEILSIELCIDGSIRKWGYEDLESQKKDAHDRLPLIGSDSKGAVKPFVDIVSNFQYLQAERLGPRSNFDLTNSNRFHKNWLGAKGEFCAELLSQADNVSRLFVGGVFEADGNVNDPRLHPSDKTQSLTRHIDAWMKEISPGISVTPKLVEEASVAVNVFRQYDNDSLKPQNVGFGVSYALSIVIALLHTRKGGLVIIENPEAHLHPKGQSYLGRLLALTALAGVQVIIETHSDHLLNGIRVAARLSESFVEGIAKVFFISAELDQSKVEEITIGNKGELSKWPDGFFDQQAADVRTLMKGKDS
ncbi:MAG: putative ATPase [Oleiphilaceae bacterium]|jgi:predicted ATPase